MSSSLERILGRDERVVSIASFKGMASPRFHTAYAPQFGGSNFALFIVNTSSPKATQHLLEEWKPRYESAFPDAYVRFKQLSYSQEAAPIEVRLTGSDWRVLHALADSRTAGRLQPRCRGLHAAAL